MIFNLNILTKYGSNVQILMITSVYGVQLMDMDHNVYLLFSMLVMQVTLVIGISEMQFQLLTPKFSVVAVFSKIPGEEKKLVIVIPMGKVIQLFMLIKMIKEFIY